MIIKLARVCIDEFDSEVCYTNINSQREIYFCKRGFEKLGFRRPPRYIDINTEGRGDYLFYFDPDTQDESFKGTSFFCYDKLRSPVDTDIYLLPSQMSMLNIKGPSGKLNYDNFYVDFYNYKSIHYIKNKWREIIGKIKK